jgi:hypothetical protein
MEHNASDAYMINARTHLLDCERLHKAIIIHPFTRRFIDKYRCIDTPEKPITLNRFTLHGGLIYYKRNAYDWKTISLDRVTAIYEA